MCGAGDLSVNAPFFEVLSGFRLDGRQPFPYRAMRRSTLRLDTDSVVDGRPDSLLAAQVSLGGLDRDVTEEKLDLFQLAAGGMTQPGACSS